MNEKQLIITCNRCNQEIETHKNGGTTVITPCPCRELTIERLNKLYGDYEIDSFSVREVLPDGTYRELFHALTDEDIEAFSGDNQ